MLRVPLSLQGRSKPVSLLQVARSALQAAQILNHVTLCNVSLDCNSVHMHVYTDGAYQNLPDKHSQIGFIFTLPEEHNHTDIPHWHSSRAPRLPASTEESKLFSLGQAFRSLENLREIVFQLLHKSVPVVLYIDNQALWLNPMNSTTTSLPDIMLRSREYILYDNIFNNCIIASENKLSIPVHRVSMLQNSPYRHSSFIPTITVSMPKTVIQLHQLR